MRITQDDESVIVSSDNDGMDLTHFHERMLPSVRRKIALVADRAPWITYDFMSDL